MTKSVETKGKDEPAPQAKEGGTPTLRDSTLYENNRPVGQILLEGDAAEDMSDGQ